MDFLAWFEQTQISIFVREEWWVFPSILSVHGVGMGLSAGANFAIALRMLGLAPRIPLDSLVKFVPLVWIGFIANVFSGIALLFGYPAKALTNWVFYAKLVLLAGGLKLMTVIVRDVLKNDDYSAGPLPAKYKRYAVLSLLLWIGVITTGRFLAYTHSILLAYWLD
jgi:hypothetical protein